MEHMRLLWSAPKRGRKDGGMLNEVYEDARVGVSRSPRTTAKGRAWAIDPPLEKEECGKHRG